MQRGPYHPPLSIPLKKRFKGRALHPSGSEAKKSPEQKLPRAHQQIAFSPNAFPNPPSSIEKGNITSLKHLHAYLANPFFLCASFIIHAFPFFKKRLKRILPSQGLFR